jgi:hypothetical protein
MQSSILIFQNQQVIIYTELVEQVELEGSVLFTVYIIQKNPKLLKN